jgi:hypothetical protein
MESQEAAKSERKASAKNYRRRKSKAPEDDAKEAAPASAKPESKERSEARE